MPAGSEKGITQLLSAWSDGDRAALDELTPQVYRELHSLARAYLNRRSRQQTLQPTALINEVYVRLIGKPEGIRWAGRAHFFGMAARLMRNILVDYARARGAEKRGGGAIAVTLDDAAAISPNKALDILDVNRALDELARLEKRKTQVIELRYFAGMSAEEIACSLGVSIPTVRRDLRFAEAWMRCYLQPQPD